MSQTVATLKAEFEGDASQLKKTIGDVKGELNSVGKAGEAAGGDIAGSFLKIAGVVASTIAAFKAVKAVYEFGEEGSKIASLGIASQKLASTYGVSMNAVVTSVKKASFNTITEYEAMKASNLALTMGVSKDAEQIGNLMEIAIMRGRAFGLTTEEAFNRITVGIGRRSIKVLDDLGFNIKGATSVQDLFNKVLAQGNEELDRMGGLAMDASVPYQRLSTVYTEFMDNLKMGVGYTLMPLIASADDVKNIQSSRAETALLTGNVKDYVDARRQAAAADQIGMGAKARAMAEASTIAYRELNAMIISSGGRMVDVTQAQADAVENLNSEMELEVGLAGDVTKAWVSYNDEMIKAGDSTEKQGAAFEKLGESYEDFILSTMKDLGAGSDATMGVAYAFGEIDDNSLAAFGAVAQLTNSFEQGAITVDQYINGLVGVKDRMDDLNGIKLKDKSMTIRINYLINGSYANMPSGLASGLGQSIITGGGNTTSRNWGMHGGSFIGMAGGGSMMVPPGFSNDGMPLFVSSGERVDVTPAGNKNSGDDDLLSEMKAIRSELKGLPIMLRDAVLLAA
jgi:hypothetical protein